ncbi:MAG: ISNCY family transposase [Synergistaceae bacterium]|nr:ISNCY family transposase [Synergistaceae bacterium]
MSRNELKRVKVLERVLSGSMTLAEGTETLGVSSRQLRRLKTKYIEEGEGGLIHGNVGRKPKNTISEELRRKVVSLYKEKYYDSNFCHLSQLLREHEGIDISPSSIGRILKLAGKGAKHPRRQVKKHRLRERRTQAGMLWQADATPYEWLGEEFGKFALHAAIDDATGIVVGAFFTPNECMEGYSEVMKQGIERYGVPLSIYSDRHTIFRSPNEKLTVDEELAGQEVPLSNFGKAMEELSIEHIKATTPQAKGRVERLWETFQDRIPVELRLLGVRGIKEANEALPELLKRHNERYKVVPAENIDAYRALEEGTRLEYIFAWRESRKICAGCSISYKNKIYVPKDETICFETRTTVETRETFSGKLIIWHKGRAVELREIERAHRDMKQNTTNTVETTRAPHKPALDHPWRRSSQYRK